MRAMSVRSRALLPIQHGGKLEEAVPLFRQKAQAQRAIAKIGDRATHYPPNAFARQLAKKKLG